MDRKSDAAFIPGTVTEAVTIQALVANISVLPEIAALLKFGGDTGIRQRQIQKTDKTEEVLAFSPT